MSVIFSAERAALSAQLYADGFSLSDREAQDDLVRLCHAGALPLSLSRNGTTLSQGFGIPIKADGMEVLYLYALTTDRAARGQGLLRTLLRESALLAKERGFAALCLLPASPPLFDAYRRMGFTEARPAGGDAAVTAPADLSLLLPMPAQPIKAEEADDFYRALGQHMTRDVFDFTLSTLAPALLPMCAEGGYALALASDARHALAASLPTVRQGTHSLLLAPLCGRLPNGIPEPLPR